MENWPAPPPDVEAEEPEGPCGDRPHMQLLSDGSRWLCAEETWRRVAPPGTDHHEMRWVHRMLPAWDRAIREARTLALSDRADPDGVGRWRAAVNALLDLAGHDDIALLAAQAQAGKAALDDVVNKGDQEAGRHGLVMVRLLDDAGHAAAEARKDRTGYEDFHAAMWQWDERQGKDDPGETNAPREGPS